MPSLNKFVSFFLLFLRVSVFVLLLSLSLSNSSCFPHDSLLFEFNLCEHMKHSSRVILWSDVNERTNEWLRLLILEHDQMWFLHPPTEYTKIQTQTPKKKIENYIDASSSFRPRCTPFDFQRGYFNDEWILLLHDIQISYICACFCICMPYEYIEIHCFLLFFENTHCNFKFHLVCGQFWFTCTHH